MTQETLTRRKVLKRAGVGAAAVWSVPFLASAASADVGIETHRGHCTNPDNSPNCVACGSSSCGTRNGTTCFCFTGNRRGSGSGCCECAGNFFCSGATPCRSNGDCPRGWKCTTSCCGSGFCAPPCGQGISAVIGAGLTAAG